MSDAPSIDDSLDAAWHRHCAEQEAAYRESLRVCDVCEERGVDPETDGETCIGCGAVRCPECGVMTHAHIARVQGAEQCSDCAAGIALERLAGWLGGDL